MPAQNGQLPDVFTARRHIRKMKMLRKFTYLAVAMSVTYTAIEMSLTSMSCLQICNAARKAHQERIKTGQEHHAGSEDFNASDDKLKHFETENLEDGFVVYEGDVCDPESNKEDLLHEPMPFRTKMITPCQVIDGLERSTLDTEIPSPFSNTTLSDDLSIFFARLYDKYVVRDGYIQKETDDAGSPPGVVILDNIQFVAAS